VSLVRLRPVWMTNHPPLVLWHCWLGHQTCKNRRPYNLYCVGADVKPCAINQSTIAVSRASLGNHTGDNHTAEGLTKVTNAWADHGGREERRDSSIQYSISPGFHVIRLRTHTIGVCRLVTDQWAANCCTRRHRLVHLWYFPLKVLRYTLWVKKTGPLFYGL